MVEFIMVEFITFNTNNIYVMVKFIYLFIILCVSQN